MSPDDSQPNSDSGLRASDFLPGDRPGIDASPEELLRRALQTRPTSGAVGPWAPPEPEALAKLLPQYRIESFLGRGGMGAVYKGRQTALDRPVAIKLLPAEMAADDSFIARFQREARTLARLQHPGIVAVYDFGQTREGHLYFVMEFVDGTDLHRVLHGPGLSEAQSLEIVSQVCDALQYAHSQGVVHRDIKPANILLTADGRAKLADFGLARPLHEESAALTRSNVVMGTPDYMAPEQIYGTADHRADLFSLGVMLYEMLTGRPPRGSWLAPSQRVQVDVRLDDVVVRALAEDPELRYQQASEIKNDVDHIRTTVLEVPTPEPAPAEPAPASPVPKARPKPKAGKRSKPANPALWIAGALLLAGAGSSWWYLGRGTPVPVAVASSPATEPAGQGEQVSPTDPIPPAKEKRQAPATPPSATGERMEAWTPFLDKPEDFHPNAPLELRDGWVVRKQEAQTSTAIHPLHAGDSAVRAEFIEVGGRLVVRQNRSYYQLERRNTTLDLILATWNPEQEKNDYRNLQRVDGLAPAADEPYTLELRAVGKVITGSLNGEMLIRVEDSNLSSGRMGIGLNVLSGSEPKARKIERLILDAEVGGTSTATSPASTPSSATATKDQPFENSLGMKFVPVPGTDVLFCIHETRWKDYAAYAAENPGVDESWKNQVANGVSITERTEDHPVIKVNWQDAQDFCAWLSKKEGRTYRLPTDEEWSLAVGLGGKESRSLGDTPESLHGKVNDVYPWGAEWPPPADAGNYSDQSRKINVPATREGDGYLEHDDGYPTTAPVMSFPPNSLRLYDMGGNVTEWVEEWFNAVQDRRVQRGASFIHHSVFNLRSSSRDSNTPTARLNNRGFRVVLAADAGVTATPAASSAPSVLGKWTRTNMDTPGAVYEMELLADGKAAWWGDGTKVDGTWTLVSATELQLEWKSGWTFAMRPPSSAKPSAMAGTATHRSGQTIEVVYEKNDSPTAATAPPADPDWQPLFPDGSLSGWTGDLSQFQIGNGILSSGKGNLVGTEEYGDFSLKFDLRLSAGAHAELGIREQNPPQPGRGAPNAAFGVVLHDDTDPGSAGWEPWRKHGAVFGYQAPSRAAMGEPGTWNEHEIRVENQHLTVAINGTTVQDVPLGKLVRQASGGRSLDLSRTRGRLAVWGFKGPVEFRNLRIRELAPSAEPAADASSPVARRLAELRAAYGTAYRNGPGQAHASAVADLDAKYLVALDRALATATSGSDLDGALALRDERQRLESGGPLPADDGAAIPALQALRRTYRTALAGLEARRDQQAAPLKDQYRQALEVYQTERTRAGDLDGALEVKKAVESLPQAPAPGTAPPEASLPAIFEEGILGHAVNDPRSLRDFPGNANLVLDHGWQDKGDAIIREARKRGLKVVMLFRNDNRAEAESAGIPLAASNRDTVLGMGWIHPNYDGVGPEALTEFGKLLKEASPSLQLWGFYVERPRGRDPGPVSPEVDVLVVAYFYAGTPAQIGEKFEDVNAIWMERAAGRPALAQWNAWTSRGEGLVPTVEKGTMEALQAQRDRYGMAGLLIGHFGDLYSPIAGLETNRPLLREIEDLARKPKSSPE